MLAFLAKLLPLFSRWDRLLLGGFFILAIVAAFAEMVGIGLVVLFVSAIDQLGALDPESTVGRIYRFVDARSPEHFVIIGAVAILAFVLGKSIYLVLLNFLKFRFMTTRQVALMQRLFATYMFAPYRLHLQRNPSELMNNVNYEAHNLFYWFLLPLFDLTIEAVVVVVLVGAMLTVEPIMTVAAVGLLALAGLIAYALISRISPRLGRQRQLHYGKMQKWVLQGLGGVKEARVLGRERFFVSAYASHTERYAMAAAADGIMRQLPRLIGEPIVVLGVVAVIAVLLLQGRGYASLLAPLTMFAVVGLRLMPSFSRIMTNLHMLRFNAASLTVVLKDLEAADLGATPSEDSPPTGALPFRDSIRFVDVRYCYPGSATPALDGVSLAIERGASVALVGSSGAGKTTLIDVLLGLLDPTDGDVLIDGRRLRDHKAAWQRKIGYIPQAIYLTDDTIRNNVAFGLPPEAIDETRLRHALATAQLLDFVDGLPAGLDTIVGDRGIRLSGGQRQRIGIARALYGDPEVLILDEATAALDNTTEREFIEAVDRLAGQKTLIYIAHRLTTIRHCDRIFLMRDGRVQASGSYDELVRGDQEFKKLAAIGQG